MTRAKISETQVRGLAESEVFARGTDYYQQGAVIDVVLRGDTLQAGVEGSEYEPYKVSITLDKGGVKTFSCTCPYDWGGACKHVVAVLLNYIHNADEVEERPALDSLLADLKAEDLRLIIVELAAQQPGIADLIEARVLALKNKEQAPDKKSSEPKQRRTPIDVASYIQQVRSELRSLDRMSSSEAYWHVSSVGSSVVRVAESARPFIAAGDGRNAVAILRAITEEYMKGWEELDDSDGDASGPFEDLGQIWAEALLAPDLSAEERKKAASQLGKWQKNLDDYGVEDVFEVAIEAARHGLDDPQLATILRGEIKEQKPWHHSGNSWRSYELTDVRLTVLDQQGRYDEYLNLAWAEGKLQEYLVMLVKRGRVDRAMEIGLHEIANSAEIMAVAEALREKGDIDRALELGKHGLEIQGYTAPLARWLRDLAAGAGQDKLAMRAARGAMRSGGTVSDYEALKALAREEWPAIRGEVLAELRKKAADSNARVEIFLQEGLIDDAINHVGAAYNRELLPRVADTAIKSRPEWVIATAKKQAAEIIEPGTASHYDDAARWLGRAKAAAKASGQEAAWRSYMEDLIARHKRKYKLVPMLEQLLKG